MIKDLKKLGVVKDKARDKIVEVERKIKRGRLKNKEEGTVKGSEKIRDEREQG